MFKTSNQIAIIIQKNSLFILLLSFSISCSPSDDTPVMAPPDTLNPIRYIALGDSYTIGQGVEESDRWPNQLVDELESNSINVEKSEIIAQTGWRTSNLINAIEDSKPQHYNLVSLLIGVNNQFNNQDFDVFKAEFNILLQSAISIAGGEDRVFVVSIPDYGVTPFGQSFRNPEVIAEELDMYNAYMNERCQQLNIPFINITEISRSLGDSEGALATDNLHPSGMQYALWVDKILPVVLEMVLD